MTTFALPPAYRLAAAAAFLLLAGHRAAAADYVRADLTLAAPWARASVSKTAQAFITIRNTGTEADRLMAISSPVAKRVELVRYEEIGGVNGAQTVKSLEIPPGNTVSLSPATLVLSLIGLKQSLTAGSTVRLTLTFARAGAVSVFARVAEAGATQPPAPPEEEKKPPAAAPKKPRPRR